MVRAKSEAFMEHEIEIADIAKALAHPVRVRILALLNEKNICQCGELVEILPLAQSTVSQHLKELKRVGLIEGEIDGPKICYCISSRRMTEAKNLFTSLFANMSCC